MRIAAITVLGLVPLLQGCESSCAGRGSGPACEDRWPASAVTIHRGATRGERDVLDDADATWLGSRDDGAGWSVSSVVDTDGTHRVLFGMPEADRVAATLAGDGDLDLPDDEERWAGAGASFGETVLAGDADGDAGWDLLVGGPDWELGRGVVWLFLDAESRGPLETDAEDFRIEGISPGDLLGTQVALCGDLSGDGEPDLVVSAPRFDVPARDVFDTLPTGTGTEAIEAALTASEAGDTEAAIPPLAGAVFVVRSEILREKMANRRADPARPNRVVPWESGEVYWGVDAGAGFGHAVLCDSDLTGDGVVDLVVGSPFEQDDDRGATYVFDGAAMPDSGFADTAATFTVPGPFEHGWLGMSLASIDFDADGLGDVVIGAPGSDRGRGQVALYTGQQVVDGDTIPRILFTPDPDNTNPDHFGRWLAVGRVDRDETDDLLIGAPDFRDGRDHDAGRLWGFLGRQRDLWDFQTIADTDSQFSILGTQPFQRVGRGVHLVDLDDDGQDEMILPIRRDPSRR